MFTLLTDCTVIDGAGNPPIFDGAVLIDGKTIADVGHADELERGIAHRKVTRIELGGATLIPGLWDAHIHLGAVVPPHEHGFAHESQWHYMLRAVRKAQDNLRAGVTSLRALGDKYDADLRLRAAIESGLVEGPRIFASGDVKWTILSAGEDEFRRRVREHIQAGVDQIKIMATGGIPWRSDNMDYMTCTEGELRAAVDEAHKWNKPVAVHAMGDESIGIASEAGVDTIEHGFVLKGDGIDAMAAAGTTFCPNLAVTDAWDPEQLEDGFFSEFLLRNATEARRYHHPAFQRAVELGIPIIAGVDNLPASPGPVGIEEHRGRIALVEELRLMVQHGLSHELALAAATREPARAARVDAVLGTLEPGKFADIVAVAGNPLEDLDALLRVEHVWKDGKKIRLVVGLDQGARSTVGHEELQGVI
jgi:imidazolonepropionase-like amidohydrolase